MTKKTKYKTEIVLQTTCGSTTTIKSTHGPVGIFSEYNPETGICTVNTEGEDYVLVNLNNVCFATVTEYEGEQ